MTIKKTANKAFHLGNRLNGDGSKTRATYGVFNDANEQVGFVTYQGRLYDAFDLNFKRINNYGAPTLANLKLQLATK